MVEIRIETQKTGESHEKHQMEVGKTVCLGIEPLDAVDNIVEQRLVVLFRTEGIIEELRNEQGDGEFVGIERNR